MDRRGLLSLFAGAGAAGATGLKPRDVVALTRGAPVGPLVSGAGAAVEPCAPEMPNLYWRTRRLHRLLDRKMEGLHRSAGPMPAHIASKRSWSAAFKASEAEREWAELRAAMDALDEETVVDRLARLLGTE